MEGRDQGQNNWAKERRKGLKGDEGSRGEEGRGRGREGRWKGRIGETREKREGPGREGRG